MRRTEWMLAVNGLRRQCGSAVVPQISTLLNIVWFLQLQLSEDVSRVL